METLARLESLALGKQAVCLTSEGILFGNERVAVIYISLGEMEVER
jgi:hypothetical protein